MFVHMTLHYPLRGKEERIVDAMKRYAAVMDGKPGGREAHLFRDTGTGKIIGLYLWDTREQWETVLPEMENAIKDDPFHEWEDMPPKVYHLEEL